MRVQWGACPFQASDPAAFHHQIRRLRGLFNSHIVQGDNKGMRKLTDDAGFAQETVARLSLCEFRGKEFHRQCAANHWIEALLLPTGCADTKSFEYFVSSDLHCGPSDL